MVKAIASLLMVFLSVTPDTFCGTPSGPRFTRFEFTEIRMGTRFAIILYAPDIMTATRAANAAFKRVEELDAIMSDYRATSELMKLCLKSGGQWARVSNDLFRVLAASQEMARRTGGAFDVTVGPLVRLWRRARRKGEMPTPQSLAGAIELTGYGKLKLDGKTRSVRFDKPGMLLDLGGIAKGYAADEAMVALKRNGIRRALVAAGGDIVVSRPPPGSRGWLIGIASLEPSGEAPKDSVLLYDAAISTSGEKEQHVEIGGVRYSHIVDPRTGFAVTGRSSVTVIAATGTISDSIATAVNVLGPQRGLELINSTARASGIIIQADAEGARTFKSKLWGRVSKRR
ncbi:MAG TPA: FAD:protein FMN transferase [Blastocatellia bacterium]|nr:FAD:protein FMN transferase [Blastocatellia bacterium]